MVANGKIKANSTATAISQTILSILDIIVARGFRTLVSFIHDSETSVLPDDVALLTAILQACLCVPGIEQSQTEILNIMAAHDAIISARIAQTSQANKKRRAATFRAGDIGF